MCPFLLIERWVKVGLPSIPALFGCDRVALLGEELEREEFPAGERFKAVLMLVVDNCEECTITFVVPNCFDVICLRGL